MDALHQLCRDVPEPKGLEQHYHFFCGDPANQEDLKLHEEKRLTLYKLVVALIRAYNNIAPEILQAGYTQTEADKIKEKVLYYVELRNSIKHYSSDYIDLKKYEPEMRQMLDMYLTADPGRMLSQLGDATLLQLMVENGIQAAVQKLPVPIRINPSAVNETIENNMRKTIIQEASANPAYYEKMSQLLAELIRLRKEGAIEYEKLLKEYEQLAKKIMPVKKDSYPAGLDTKAKQALYDNLNQNTGLAIALDKAILITKDDEWRGNVIKQRKLMNAIRAVLADYGIQDESEVERVFQLIDQQVEY